MTDTRLRLAAQAVLACIDEPTEWRHPEGIAQAQRCDAAREELRRALACEDAWSEASSPDAVHALRAERDAALAEVERLAKALRDAATILDEHEGNPALAVMLARAALAQPAATGEG
jgi:hypothetical protein